MPGVFDATGSPLTVGAALNEISAVLGEVLDDFAGDLDPPTRWAMRWFADNGFDEGPLDHAERLCLQAGRLSVEELRRVGIITRPHDSRVRLVKRDDLPKDWSPATDPTTSVWELLQHVLARFLSKDSERGAAALLRQRPSAMADTQELAYWLFRAVERTRPEEARRIDLLLTSWPRIEELVAAEQLAEDQQLNFGAVDG